MPGFSKGGWVHPETMEDGAREAEDWVLYPASSRRSPAPTGFFSVPFPPPVCFGLLPFCVRGQANLLFQSSCFNVLVTLPPPLDPPPSLPQHSRVRGAPMLRVPFTALQNEPPKHQLIFREATSASAATPRPLVDLVDPVEDLNFPKILFLPFLRKDCHGGNPFAIFFNIARSPFLAFPSYTIGAALVSIESPTKRIIETRRDREGQWPEIGEMTRQQ